MPRPLSFKTAEVRYSRWLTNIKKLIRERQHRAMVKVNEELLQLYWDIGKSILQKQQELGWGAKVIDKLSADLKRLLPDSRGFSSRNLKYMRQFAFEYPDFPIVQVPLAQLKNQFVQVPLAQISWFHHVTLLTEVSNMQERGFYIRMASENGWSRNTMLHQIESRLYKRQGKAITNFKQTLPSPDSELAREIFKDPYNFDFLSLKAEADERNIEEQLTLKISNFLLELGKGFAYVGRQFHLEIAEEDYYIDLLFYHLTLRCYVVIELKAGSFKPEYVGKLNFYLSAVDSILANPADNPAIGLLLCKSKNNIVAEYALRGNTKPMGVASYKLSKVLPRNIKSKLPSIEEIETNLKLKIKK